MWREKVRLVSVVAFLAPLVARGAETDAARQEFFEKKVRPILVENCHACHSAETKPAGGLRVDDRNGLITGGNTGPAVVPGHPEKSLLLKRVAKGAQKIMPAEGDHLDEEEVKTLTRWVADGAYWPPTRIPATLGKPKASHEKLKKEHWAWQPLTRPAIPQVKAGDWPRDPVDQFILVRLEGVGLQPVADADKASLIRRVTFDLTGLPPTPAEVDAFLRDGSPQAFDRLVDRLLASARFGEKWGRWWLDVARYGESTGPSRNIPYPHAWRYRDYVIDSLNADIPFNRFIREQVAGDLLPEAGSPGASDKEKDRLNIATGFLALGVKDVNQRFKVRFQMDNVDEQIDTVTRSVLGLTVSCARCHDHKFDPVSQHDYYALAGIFTSTENAAGVKNLMGGGGLAYYVPEALVRLNGNLPPVPQEQLAKLKREVEEAKKAWDTIRGTPEGLKPAANGLPTQRPFRLKYEKLQSDLLALTDPGQRGQAAHGAREAKVIADTEIRIRGEAEKLGPVVARGFISTFEVPGARPVNPAQSGRLELADWLVSDNNPLPARVIVNRIWGQLFQRGLVSTVDNFGVNGDKPTHPELLDHLASRFQADGWSIKKLVRALVLTRAYQLGTDAPEKNRKLDPANTLVWRHAPRRLTAEEFRDAALALSGQLDLKRPEGSPAKELKMIELPDNGPVAKGIREAADKSRHRSIYLPLLRGITPRALEAFDPVEQTLVTGSREETTVPAQALFVLNSAFVRKQALQTAEGLLARSDSTDQDRIRELYRKALGRGPLDSELSRALAFLGNYESLAKTEPLLARGPKVDSPNPVAKPSKPDEPPLDPDQADQSGEAVVQEVVEARDPRTAAWLALAQAVLGSGEFRFLR